MNNFIHLFLIIPLLGFIISLLIPAKNENAIAKTTIGFIGLHLLLGLGFTLYWLFSNHPTLNIKDIIVYKRDDYEFFIDFCFDKITVVYLLVGSILSFLVTIYCSYYLHREEGYKRFFNTILFFFLGYNVVIFSGNFETLFIGWEILGISSFLLISFYRERYLPVKNALKVFSIYRLGDIGLILAMWMSHHLWHENITFLKLSNNEFVHAHLDDHSSVGVFISLMILIAAAAKSAQLPFSSWLPRAMEGPTPSSAIFYGSLSVHIGAFLLLRTFPFWENQTSIRILIVLLGALSAILASGIARVQSSVKSQIAYSSIVQIGIIFIEIALGFEKLALFHFAGNAFLRTYQLLVSPSVVTYLIREQFYNFVPRAETIEDSIPRKLQNTLYLMSLKEWNLDNLMYNYLWSPIKWLGKKLDFLTIKSLTVSFVVTYILAFALLVWEELPAKWEGRLAIVFGFIAVSMVLKSFTERKNPQVAWFLIVMNHFWITLAVSFNERFTFDQVVIYLSGVVLSGLLGSAAIARLRKIEGKVSLDHFQGYSYAHPKIALFFLLCCLGLTGFPISPTFVGEDLVFTHIHEDQLVLAALASISFIVDGLSIVRIYARIFLGPHVNSIHEMAHRSS